MGEEEISKLESKAKELISKGRIDEASKLIDKILEEEPQHKSAIFNKAHILLQKDKLGEALDLFEKLIDMDIDDSEVWYHKGTIHFRRNEYSKALDAFDMSTTINPRHIDSHLQKGWLYLNHKSKPDEARICYDKVTKIYPDHPIAWHGKGLVYLEKKVNDLAENCLMKAVKIDPTYAQAWCNLGVAYMKMEKFDLGISCLDNATDLRPDYKNAWFNKFRAYEEKGNKKKARECHLKYMGIDEDDLDENADFPLTEAYLEKRHEEQDK